ncbi:hypothetical protein KDW19_00485 [Burkholderia cenocepacia]|jgi:hypothetical protein|uniref:Uncharacterized protein n=4 Tax=Burkholderia cepacia complex TaxID=87882 RepID=A0A3R9AYW4_9BURK|nr:MULTISPECIES: hypothetical protein [Burkholderia]EKS9842103.1 hypothetical protein [Burkholderia cepacia]BEV51125.1 hypothetical protein BconGalA64_36240 [Burkholderia contaminans]ABK10076.1 conserved hypothetical protein [Burkholderia cenocepacia HI2424]ACA93331.1 hypothetical protein Bcenmc03_4180 [Burkholderia orbicola MC0-3]AQQ25360.1 hypothetical protein A8E88_06550 [Burkholderia cenocepacia]
MEEPAPYSLSGALSVQDDLDDEQLDRVSRHLSGIASVYVKHDTVAHTVSLCISGTLMRDDARYIEQRIERFAEEHARAASILLSEWNGVTSELVVGMNWDAQCLIKLAAIQEQLGKLPERYFDFLLRLEPAGAPARGKQFLSVSIETSDDQQVV